MVQIDLVNASHVSKVCVYSMCTIWTIVQVREWEGRKYTGGSSLTIQKVNTMTGQSVTRLWLQLVVSIDLGVKCVTHHLKSVLFNNAIHHVSFKWCNRPDQVNKWVWVWYISCVLLHSHHQHHHQQQRMRMKFTHTHKASSKHSMDTHKQLFVSFASFAEMYMFTYIWGQLWRVVPINRFFVCWPVVANVRDALFADRVERERERERTEEGKT